MQTAKILFIDLEAVRDKSGIFELFKSWRGFQCVGLAAPAHSLNMSDAIANQFALIKSLPKIKTIYIPFEDGSRAFQVLSTGEATMTPSICAFDYRFAAGGMIEFYLNKYLTRPSGWLVSDRLKEQTPSDICGLTYISGADWRQENPDKDF